MSIEYRDYQFAVIKDCYQWFKRGYRQGLIYGPTGSGKCLGKGTPVMMYNGTIKNVEDVQIGDLLMGDDSTPRTVLSLAKGQEELFKITPVKGDSWVCNRSHILSLVSSGTDCGLSKNQVYDVPLSDYVGYNKTRKHILKQYRVSVENFGGDKTDLPVDPWLLGLFMGDGNKYNGSIHLNDTNKVEVATRASALMVSIGYRVSCQREMSKHGIRLKAYKTSTTTTFIDYVRQVWGVKELKAHDLFIPHNYKTSSIENRLSLLAGLLDSDGDYDGRSISFSCVSEKLADDVCFISRSLGFSAYKSFRITKCNGISFPSYRVSISGNFQKIPCIRFDFKMRGQIKDVSRTGFSVESLGIGDYYGFEIDGNRRFLLGDFTVTHNTAIASKIIQDSTNRSRRVLFCCHRKRLIAQTVKALLNIGVDDISIIASGMTIERLAKLLEKPVSSLKNIAINDHSKPIQVCMIQTLEAQYRRMGESAMPPNIGLVITDESHICGFFNFSRIIESHYSGGIMALSKCFFLWLTATPWRSESIVHFTDTQGNKLYLPDGKPDKGREGYCKYVQFVVKCPSPRDLITQGYLAQDRILDIKTEVTDSLETDDSGDYTMGSLIKACNSEYNAKIVETYVNAERGKKAIAFTSNVNQAKDLCQQFLDAGVSAKYLVGENDKDADKIFLAHSKKEFDVLVGVGKFTEGHDDPSLEVELIGRPSRSPQLIIQMAGRVLRKCEGIPFKTIYDFGECFKHICNKFKIDDPLDLSHVFLCPPEKENMALEKQCPECEKFIPVFAKICPHCGYTFPVKEVQPKDYEVRFVVSEFLSPEKKKAYKWLRYQLFKRFTDNHKPLDKIYEHFYERWGYFPHPDWFIGAIFNFQNSTINHQIYSDRLKLMGVPQDLIEDFLYLEFGYPDKVYFLPNGREYKGTVIDNLTQFKWWEIIGTHKFAQSKLIKEKYQEKLLHGNVNGELLNLAYEFALNRETTKKK